MNIIENVKLVSDNGLYVSPRYSVISCTIGSTTATSFVWLKCISYGIASQQDFDDYKTSVQSGIADKSKLQGPYGQYVVAKISDIVPYTRPASIDHDYNFTSPWQIG